MNQRLLLYGIAFLILVSLLAGPALAATVTCPSSCSCLLPADAKKLGYFGLCSGKQLVCGSLALQKRYCYEKPATAAVPQLIITAHQFVTTTPTTIPATPCPSTCTCIPDEKAQGAATPPALCGKTKTYCGSTAAGVKQYCYLLPLTVTTTPTTIPVPADGTQPDITTRPPSDNGPADVSLRPSDGPVPDLQRKTTTPVPSDNAPPSLFSTIGTFFTSLFGSTSAPQSSSLQPVPCNGVITYVMTDPDNCGSCGVQCSSGLCIEGECTDNSRRATACGPGSVQCNGTCTYTRSDENNCGSCGHTCPTGEYCCAGVCTTLRTTENCGTCGNRCGSGQACCSGTCTDITADRLNCGSCGHPCPGSSVCENGVCIDRTCEEALFLERKENADLRARLDRLGEKYAELEHRFGYCLWLEDYYKDGYNACCGRWCEYPPEPTDNSPMVTEYESET